MISTLIIDDEMHARFTLQAMLERYFIDKVKVVDSVESVKEGVFSIHKHHPDLVFLDIEMPDENGFKLFEYFAKVPFTVIFVTAYQNFAIDAIKVAALDYILKPVSYKDLQISIDLYEKRKAKGIPQEHIQLLLNSLNPVTDSKGKVALPTFTGYQLEKVNSIMYCEAEQNYTKVFTISGEPILVSKPISYIEEILPNDIFFRIHKSFLVNLNFIKSYDRSEGYQVVLDDGTTLDVATRRNQDFLKALTGGQ
jgi:two-component system LytT family response regulator